MKYTTKVRGLRSPIVTSFPIEVSLVPNGLAEESSDYGWTLSQTAEHVWGMNADRIKYEQREGSIFHFAIDDSKVIQLLPIQGDIHYIICVGMHLTPQRRARLEQIGRELIEAIDHIMTQEKETQHGTQSI